MTVEKTPQQVVDLIQEILNASTDDFSELANIAELDLKEDFIGIDLSNEDLSCNNLSGVDLTDANLRNAILCNADLSNAVLVNSNLSNADLSHANLSGADLTGANLTDANFTRSLLNDTTKLDIEWMFLVSCDQNEEGVIDSANSSIETASFKNILNKKTPHHIKDIISHISTLPFDIYKTLIFCWIENQESKVVCIANLQMIIEAYSSKKSKTAIEVSDLVITDELSLMWTTRLLGANRQIPASRLTIFYEICNFAQRAGKSVYLLGADTFILQDICGRLNKDFPSLCIAGMQPLHLDNPSVDEDEALIRGINESGSSIVLLTLASPKQEQWMTQYKGEVQAVMIGLGDSFVSAYKGIRKTIPNWVSSLGLEWAYRLMLEPGRLYRRYTITSLFLFLTMKQLLMESRSDHQKQLYSEEKRT